jgi:hypothetical protein
MFGRGIDTHGDPSQLDVERLRSLMQPTEGDPMAGLYVVEDQVDDRQHRLFWIGRIQTKLAVLAGGDPASGNQSLSSGAGMTLGVNDAATQALLTEWVRATKIGATEDRRLDQVLAAREHTHPGYALNRRSHDGYSDVSRSHRFSGTTEGVDA